MSRPYNIILRQLGGIGDFLMMSPVARGMKEKYPHHKLCLITSQLYLGGSLTDLAEHNPFWDEIHIIEPNEATTQESREVWAQYFAGSQAIENDLFWQKAEVKIDENCACVQMEWPALRSPEGITKSRVQAWCERAEVTPSSLKPIYVLTPKEVSIGRQYAEEYFPAGVKVVGVGISAADSKRAMGQIKLKQICDGLKAQGFYPVTIDPTFHFDDVPYLIGLRIREIMPILAQMDCVISCDSGLVHLAGALGTPIVGVFGPTNPDMRLMEYNGSGSDGKTLVPCAHCWYNFPCLKDPHVNLHYLCLQRVMPEVIIEEVHRVIQRFPKPF